MNDKDLQARVSRITKNKKVFAVFLFGSRANKRARKDSDIDLAVMGKGLTREEELNIISFGDDTFDISIFYRLPLSIQFRIVKEGILLFCRDENLVHREKIFVLKKYLDFSSKINQFYRRVINGI